MNATWNASANRLHLQSGTEVFVLSAHERVRIRTADILSIDMPDRTRLSAVVIDRTGGSLVLAVNGSTIVRLKLSEVNDADPTAGLSQEFPKQGWTVQ